MAKDKARLPLVLGVMMTLALLLVASACSGNDVFEGNGAGLDVSPIEDGFAFC